jgi:hypothetical protein
MNLLLDAAHARCIDRLAGANASNPGATSEVRLSDSDSRFARNDRAFAEFAASVWPGSGNRGFAVWLPNLVGQNGARPFPFDSPKPMLVVPIAVRLARPARMR